MVTDVPTARTYDDPCGIARALDLVGQRWALLVVRELLLGPKRFAQLRRGLHDASTNALTRCLRDLEQAGVVGRRSLGPPTGAAVYELTPRGHDLEPVLLELGRWGSQAPLTSSAELGVDSLILSMTTLFDGDRAGRLGARYELRLDEDRYRLEVADGHFDVCRGEAENPDAVIDTDAATFAAILFGARPLQDAVTAGGFTVAGDRASVDRLVFALTSPPDHHSAGNPAEPQGPLRQQRARAGTQRKPITRDVGKGQDK